MCGRFSITSPWEEIKQRFEIDFPEEAYKPRYNAAPSQDMLVVPQESPHEGEFYHWGLIPHWAKDPKIGNRLINARAETVAEKPSFRGPFKNHRCLVLADGFYEWDRKSDRKVPYRITLKDGGLFAFAGIYDTWHGEGGKEVKSFSIITTEPNELLSDIHDRMPVILSKRQEREWLDPEVNVDEAKKMLLPFPAQKMAMQMVSTAINSPRNDNPAVIVPA